MNATKISGFIGIALGIGFMNYFGFSGILLSALFGALGGGVGGAVGALIEHKGKSKTFVFLIDNTLWALLFFVVGLVIGVIISSNLNISNGFKTSINVISGIIFSICFTARKVSHNNKSKKLSDDNTL